MREVRETYKTISFPTKLYQQIKEIIPQTGFRSVTEFVLYYTRRAVARIQKENEKSRSKKVKEGLKTLGYFE